MNVHEVAMIIPVEEDAYEQVNLRGTWEYLAHEMNHSCRTV